MEINKIYQGDSLESLKTFPDKSINCCVTSPPYYGLRDYGTGQWVGGDNNCSHTSNNSRNGESAKVGNTRSGEQGGASHINLDNVCVMCGATKVDLQLGLEQTPELYVERLVTLFREVKRVLRDDGTLWLNLGDSYAGGGRGYDTPKQQTNKGTLDMPKSITPLGMKQKDLMGIPWMVAFALRADGWYLRQDIIWHKPNPMPESVTDRCTKAHEYIFLLSKSRKYYYDYEAIKEIAKNPDDDLRRINAQTWDNKNTPDNLRNGIRPRKFGATKQDGTFRNDEGNLFVDNGFRNKRSVWECNTMPYSEAHFATFPPKLIVDCIKAGCPENGIVLDPFMGSGTTAMVSRKLNRNYIGCELNPKYIKIAEKRLRDELGMFQ